MARATFASFHYQRDYWRVQQVLNLGAITGQIIMPAQKWEEVKRQGDAAIQAWIDDQMKYKAAVVVLVGNQTASRRWVKYEVGKAWTDRKPLVGIRVHGLADQKQNTDTAGPNPFGRVHANNGSTLESYIPLYTPSGVDSKAVYASIQANLSTWVDSAVKRS